MQLSLSTSSQATARGQSFFMESSHYALISHKISRPLGLCHDMVVVPVPWLPYSLFGFFRSHLSFVSKSFLHLASSHCGHTCSNERSTWSVHLPVLAFTYTPKHSTQLNFIVTYLQLNSWTAGLLNIAQHYFCHYVILTCMSKHL